MVASLTGPFWHPVTTSVPAGGDIGPEPPVRGTWFDGDVRFAAEESSPVFNTIVVAVDVASCRNRAIPLAASLARLGSVPVEVVSVSPGRSRGVHEELARRAAAEGMAASSCAVLDDDDIAGVIIERVSDRGALLVLETSAKGLMSEHLRGSVSSRVLSELLDPVLLIGPSVPDTIRLGHPTLVDCTDRSQDSCAAIPVVASWMRTFGGGRPWVVEVRPTSAWPQGTVEDSVDSEHVQAIAARLRGEGVDASTRVLHGGDPTEWLLQFVAGVDDALPVSTSSRWAGGRSHWYSTTRRLVQRSRRPVLVVPADRPVR